MVAKVDAFSEQCFDLDKVGMGSPPSPSQGVLFGGSLGSSGSGGKWELDRNRSGIRFWEFRTMQDSISFGETLLATSLELFTLGACASPYRAPKCFMREGRDSFGSKCGVCGCLEAVSSIVQSTAFELMEHLGLEPGFSERSWFRTDAEQPGTSRIPNQGPSGPVYKSGGVLAKARLLKHGFHFQTMVFHT